MSISFDQSLRYTSRILVCPKGKFISRRACSSAISKIKGAGFFGGGHTGRYGLYQDAYGHNVAGTVHIDEYVVPAWMMDRPDVKTSVNYLEGVRRTKGSFFEGGFTSVNTTPSGTIGLDVASGSAAANNNSETMKALSDIRDAVQS